MKSKTPLRRLYLEQQLQITRVDERRRVNQEKRENEIKWITLFRRNWHIYVDMVLEISLKPFQQLMIYLMGVSDVFFAICSRGASKSFLVALAALVKMLLFPYSEIVVTSSTLPQANKLVEDKILNELIKKLSPYLLYLYDNEYIVIKKQDEGYLITCTLNGSTLKVLPCLDSSRGSRATMIVYEECRLLKKSLIDSVFRPMAHPRQAKFLLNPDHPEYAKSSRWKEECQYIYITSSRFKHEWFWRSFKDCVTGYYNDKRTRYNIFATDIFTAIDNGLKTWGDLRRAKRMSTELEYRMEDLNEMIGESEKAFFSIKSFVENQTLTRAFVPPTATDIIANNDLGNPQKADNEVRMVITDYAFANTTSREKNDNTIIMLMSLHWKGNRFERHVDYLGGHPASDSLGACDRARELFWDFEGNYWVCDQRSGGESLFNRATMPWEHPERGRLFDSRGLTVVDDMTLHVVPEGKVKDLRDRTVDKNAVPCIIPVIATHELNSTMWLELKKQLETNNIKFLISVQDKQTELEDNGEYFKLTSEELAETLVPYGQVEALIQEAVNLSAEFKDGRVKLTEPRSGTKDRAVVLAYGNYIASLIENQWNQMLQTSDEDYEGITLVW